MRCHRHPHGLKGSNLGRRRTARALDDRTCVAHAPAWRSHTTGHKGDYRLGHMLGNERCSPLFSAPADLAY